MDNTQRETTTGEGGYLEFPDFEKVDLRVGTVTSAEKVQKSDKLIRLRIDDGAGGRQVLAGIAGHVDPDALVGMQVVFVANLKPRDMMGERSEGMVLAAVDGGKLTLLRPSEDVPPGTKVS
ncbi:methionine--tRNA ligase subunit beta [Candidatus Latescibacterota bacterium]